jgi:hypothetical protein
MLDRRKRIFAETEQEYAGDRKNDFIAAENLRIGMKTC